VFVSGMSAFVAAVGLLIGLAAGGVLGSTPAARGPKAGVVVLVPGYGGSTTGVDVLADHIRRIGMGTEVVRLPDRGLGDLVDQADVVNGYVDKALRTGARQVDVVGFSAGGVVARLWDAEYDGGVKVRRVITLGSPLNGTRIAAAGNAADPSACPIACQELVPGSTLLTQLRRMPLRPRPGWLSVWTEDDQVVRPPDSARLPGAVNVPVQTVCPGVVMQHGQLPVDPLVIGIVLRALGTGSLTAPGPADCDALEELGRLP
jgi:pimeloyl-ACP methyl ester carboxylesterase